MTQQETPIDKGPETLRIWLLGGFRVSVGSGAIEEKEWRLRKAAALVKLLALAPGHRLHREQVMDLLWPNLGHKAGSNNLRRTLHAARRTLGSGSNGSLPYIVSRQRHLMLYPGGRLWVDVEAFEEAAATARRLKTPSAYRAAIRLYAGELLPEDRYEEWAQVRRRELREIRLSLLTGLAAAHEGQGDHGSAIEALREVVAEDPVREEAHVSLMRLFALAGSRTQALRQYESLRETISRELGSQPSASARSLREEIASGRFSSGAPPPVLPHSEEAQRRLHGLPRPRTTFVDRERELAEVGSSLGTTRLLTLTGTGGSGKTRLAVRVANALATSFPDGVWFAGFAGLSEPGLVTRAVASALGAREQPGLSLAEAVAGVLRDQRILLLLDNCEHLVGAVARLVDVLLETCPHLKVLATSREPLRVEGEALFLVAPLPVPRESSVGADEVARNESVRLFVERTRRRLSGFSLTQENARAVAELCRRLEGMPLALELAAARMGTLATQQLTERLRDSLALLSGGPRTAPTRQRTMRATFDWSYGLLSEEEKALFRRLSVFAGGFALEAAEAVCPGGDVEEGEVLELISGLVDKSLVLAETPNEDRVRYRMLELVRQYARERLDESGEAEEVGHRHAAFFLDLAERVEPELKGPGQVEWLARLETDNDNLRSAMAWLLEKGEIEAVVRMAWALWIFWLIHGHQAEGRRWIEKALDEGENLTAHARAKALAVQLSTYYGLGDPERVEQIAEEAVALFRQVGDNLGLVYALGCLAGVKMQQGEAERAIALFEEAFPLGRELGDWWGLSGALGHLGSIYLARGNPDRATLYFEEGLAMSREIGNRLAEVTALYGLAMAAQGQDDQNRAAELYTEGLKSAAEAGDKANIAYSLEGLAYVAAAQGETGHAARLFGAAEAVLGAAGGTLYAYAQDRSAHEQAVDALRSRMDEAAFSAAWAEGRAMSPGEAVEYALSGKERALPADRAVPEEHAVGLTSRQEEVAALVARGLTNRRIALELSISERTVEKHVARIFEKLELVSRAQIAAWWSERSRLSSGLEQDFAIGGDPEHGQPQADQSGSRLG